MAERHSNWVTWLRVAVHDAMPYVVASLGLLAGCRSRSETDSDNDNEGQP